MNHQEKIKIGEISVRQRGTKYVPGANVSKGGDDTLYAAATGMVKFATSKKTRFDNSRRAITVVHVIAD